MEDVYEFIVKASQTFTLPSPWQTVPCDPAFIRLPTDRRALLAELRQQFPDERLVQAGVVTMDTSGNVSLVPQLAAGVAPIWVIRRESDRKLTAIIAEMNLVGKNAWALAAAFQDPRQRDLIGGGEGRIVVAYSMQDLAILRSIGLAAVPGGNWCRLTKPQLDFLCEALGITPRSSGPPTKWAKAMELIKPRTVPLILANWSLAGMDRTDVAAATTSWSHLVELYRHLDLTFDHFGLWKPSHESLAQLEFQLRYLDVEAVCDALLEGIGEDSITIDAGLGPNQPEPQSIVESYRAWRRADRDAMNPPARQKAFAKLCELLDQKRFDPLVEEALRATSALERNAEIALAETSRLLQPQLLLLAEKIRRSIGENGTRTVNSISKEELEPVLALSDRLLALTQGVQACRRNQPAKLIKVLKPRGVRCKRSASSEKKSPR